MFQLKGSRHDYAKNGKISAFFCFKCWCASLSLVEHVLQKGRLISFFVVATHFSCRTLCTMTNKQHNCQFLVLNRKIQHVKAGFELLLVVETRIFNDWKMNTLFIRACWTIHISNNTLSCFFRVCQNTYPLTKLQEKRICLFFKTIKAHLTHGLLWAHWQSLPLKHWEAFRAGKVYPNTLYSENTRSQLVF